MKPEIRGVGSSPKLSCGVLLYCCGPEVIQVGGSAEVDQSNVLNQVNGKKKKNGFRTGHLIVLLDHNFN